ncbi:MAG: hypothetical protein ACLUNZ_13350 [Evtepia sp.]
MSNLMCDLPCGHGRRRHEAVERRVRRPGLRAPSSPPWARPRSKHCARSERRQSVCLGDKGYLETLYRQGAEKAAALANRTLRKVHKKVGFAAR